MSEQCLGGKLYRGLRNHPEMIEMLFTGYSHLNLEGKGWSENVRNTVRNAVANLLDTASGIETFEVVGHKDLVGEFYSLPAKIGIVRVISIGGITYVDRIIPVLLLRLPRGYKAFGIHLDADDPEKLHVVASFETADKVEYVRGVATTVWENVITQCKLELQKVAESLP